MYRYGQFCPIAVACEVFAERWTPLVRRELAAGSRRFNELQRGVPLMSRTLLAQRLRELEAAGLVERVPKPNGHGFEYRLRPAGEELKPIILQLGEWGRRWVYTRVSREDLDPGLLMWDMHRRIHTDALPERRVVVQFEFLGLPRGSKGAKHWWLVLERPDVELCLKDPGYAVDLLVTAAGHDPRLVRRADAARRCARRSRRTPGSACPGQGVSHMAEARRIRASETGPSCGGARCVPPLNAGGFPKMRLEPRSLRCPR